jgi:hypothetical protein
MGLDTSYDNISEVLSLLQRYKQKIIVHNGDNYTNKFYLTPNQNIEIFSVVYSFIRSALTNILAYSLQSMLFLLFLFVWNLSSSSYPSFYPYVLNILFHLIFLYIYFIINV